MYLACPCSHANPRIRSERYELATRMAAALMKQGHSFSPITQGHQICKHDIGHGFDTWKNTDLSMIELWATDVYMLHIDGCKEKIAGIALTGIMYMVNKEDLSGTMKGLITTVVAISVIAGASSIVSTLFGFSGAVI